MIPPKDGDRETEVPKTTELSTPEQDAPETRNAETESPPTLSLGETSDADTPAPREAGAELGDPEEEDTPVPPSQALTLGVPGVVAEDAAENQTRSQQDQIGSAESETTESSAGAAKAADEEAEGAAHSDGGGNTKANVPPEDTSVLSLEAMHWRSTSRAIVLFGLLGMALVSWFRLSRGGELASELLRQNAMPMPERDVFLMQILGTGFAAAFLTLCAALFWTKVADLSAQLERWGWFLSPLILLPAIPVMGCVTVWHQKHETLLPLVLFLALLTEFFVARCLQNLPPALRAGTDGINWKVGPPQQGTWLRKNAWLLATVAAALFYAIFMSYFTIRWHNRLGTATFDLGINNNLIFGGLHGKFNQSTVIFPEDPQKYLANHVKLGLYLFLPIYKLHPEAETLLALQSVSLGLGSIPLFLFARRRIPEWGACVLALCYLAYYPMHGANFYEMKLVPTAAAFVLTMIWAVDTKRWIVTGIFFFFSLLMREDLPVPLAVIGGFLLLSGARPRAGAIICGVSIAWFVLVRFKLMSDAGAWWFPNMYEDLWSEPETGFRSVLKTLVSNPAFVLKHIFTEQKFWYMLHLLIPVAFLPLRRWYLWAALVPGAILTLLVTNYDPPVMFSFQYVMHWSPYLFVCAALALKAIASETNGKARASAALAAVAVASGALSYNYGAFPLRDRALQAGYHKIKFDWGPEEQEQYEQVQRLKQAIPREASVATTERIGAHLSSRVLFYTLRRGNQGATYLVARRSGLRLGRTREVIEQALESGEYGVIGRYGEFVLMQKGAKTEGNEEILSEWHLGKKKRSRDDRREARKQKRPGTKPSLAKGGASKRDQDGEQEDSQDDEDEQADQAAEVE